MKKYPIIAGALCTLFTVASCKKQHLARERNWRHLKVLLNYHEDSQSHMVITPMDSTFTEDRFSITGLGSSKVQIGSTGAEYEKTSDVNGIIEYSCNCGHSIGKKVTYYQKQDSVVYTVRYYPSSATTPMTLANDYYWSL